MQSFPTQAEGIFLYALFYAIQRGTNRIELHYSSSEWDIKTQHNEIHLVELKGVMR